MRIDPDPPLRRNWTTFPETDNKCVMKAWSSDVSQAFGLRFICADAVSFAAPKTPVSHDAASAGKATPAMVAR